MQWLSSDLLGTFPVRLAACLGFSAPTYLIGSAFRLALDDLRRSLPLLATEALPLYESPRGNQVDGSPRARHTEPQ